MVDLNEFGGAVAPIGTPESTIRQLEAKGIQVELYDPNDEAARTAARNKFGDMAFDAGGGVIVGGAALSANNPEEAQAQDMPTFQSVLDADVEQPSFQSIVDSDNTMAMTDKFLSKRLSRKTNRGKSQDLKAIAKEPDLAAKIFAGGEVASNIVANMGIGLAEDAMSGWKKIITGDANTGVDLPEYPIGIQTELGQEYAQNVGDFIAPAAETVGRFSDEWSDEGAEYGPAIGATRKTLFDAPIIGDALAIGGGAYQYGKENIESFTDEVRQLRIENDALKRDAKDRLNQ